MTAYNSAVADLTLSVDPWMATYSIVCFSKSISKHRIYCSAVVLWRRVYLSIIQNKLLATQVVKIILMAGFMSIPSDPLELDILSTAVIYGPFICLMKGA